MQKLKKKQQERGAELVIHICKVQERGAEFVTNVVVPIGVIE